MVNNRVDIYRTILGTVVRVTIIVMQKRDEQRIMSYKLRNKRPPYLPPPTHEASRLPFLLVITLSEAKQPRPW